MITNIYDDVKHAHQLFHHFLEDSDEQMLNIGQTTQFE